MIVEVNGGFREESLHYGVGLRAENALQLRALRLVDGDLCVYGLFARGFFWNVDFRDDLDNSRNPYLYLYADQQDPARNMGPLHRTSDVLEAGVPCHMVGIPCTVIPVARIHEALVGDKAWHSL